MASPRPLPLSSNALVIVSHSIPSNKVFIPSAIFCEFSPHLNSVAKFKIASNTPLIEPVIVFAIKSKSILSKALFNNSATLVPNVSNSNFSIKVYAFQNAVFNACPIVVPTAEN